MTGKSGSRSGRCVPVRDGQGRLRDKNTGRFISQASSAAESTALAAYETSTSQKCEDDEARLKIKGQSAMSRKLIEFLQAEGLEASSFEELWAVLLGVQAQIALDKNNGSKATAAAKLLAQMMSHLLDEEKQEGEASRLILGRRLAAEVLVLVEQEAASRELLED